MSEGMPELSLPENITKITPNKKEIKIGEVNPEKKRTTPEQKNVNEIFGRFEQLEERYRNQVNLDAEGAEIKKLVEQSKNLTEQYLGSGDKVAA